MDSAVDELVTHRMVDVGEVTLHVAEAGTGPLVVLLHGFPEFWYGWRHQIPALAAAGYRVAAPDLRGYGLSDKPRGEAAYAGPALTGDVAGLVRALGEQRAVIVGHDWGGIVAWLTAMSRPEVVDRLVIANAPHPAVFGRALASPAQLLRSSYMGFFQLPAVPELLLGAGRATVLRRLLRAATVRPDAFSEADLARYAEAFAEPGALSGALAYYRSMGRRLAADAGARVAARVRREAPAPGRSARPITTPTLVLWGAADPVLPPRLADPGHDLLPNGRVQRIEGAGHFVQSEDPETFNAAVLDFLREGGRAPAPPEARGRG